MESQREDVQPASGTQSPEERTFSETDEESYDSDNSSDSSEGSLKYTLDSKIDEFLISLNLDKYIPFIYNEGFNFETFINMSTEDMNILGIDVKDQEILRSNSSTLTHRFEKYDNQSEINFDKVLENTCQQLEKVCSRLILTRNKLKNDPEPENIFLDDTTSTAEALELLADKALDTSSFIEDDVKKLKNYNSSWKNIFFNEYTAALGLISVITYSFFKNRH